MWLSSFMLIFLREQGKHQFVINGSIYQQLPHINIVVIVVPSTSTALGFFIVFFCLVRVCVPLQTDIITLLDSLFLWRWGHSFGMKEGYKRQLLTRSRHEQNACILHSSVTQSMILSSSLTKCLTQPIPHPHSPSTKSSFSILAALTLSSRDSSFNEGLTAVPLIRVELRSYLCLSAQYHSKSTPNKIKSGTYARGKCQESKWN